MKCPKCRMKIPNGAEICPYCRSKVSSWGIFGDMYDNFTEGYKESYNKAKAKLTQDNGDYQYSEDEGGGVSSDAILPYVFGGIAGGAVLIWGGISGGYTAMLILGIVVCLICFLLGITKCAKGFIGTIVVLLILFFLGRYLWNRVTTSESSSKSQTETENVVETTTETPKNVDESAVDFTAVAEEEYVAEEYSTDEASNDEHVDEAGVQEVQEVEEVADIKENEVLDVVEQMPSFPGGETMLKKYLSSNVNYPEVAVENEIQGRVVVTFVVERDGSITDVKVAKGVDPSLDREAVRVTKSMPRWKAGIQNGKAVRVKYTMPVTFSLTIAE